MLQLNLYYCFYFILTKFYLLKMLLTITYCFNNHPLIGLGELLQTWPGLQQSSRSQCLKNFPELFLKQRNVRVAKRDPPGASSRAAAADKAQAVPEQQQPQPQLQKEVPGQHEQENKARCISSGSMGTEGHRKLWQLKR